MVQRNDRPCENVILGLTRNLSYHTVIPGLTRNLSYHTVIPGLTRNLKTV